MVLKDDEMLSASLCRKGDEGMIGMTRAEYRLVWVMMAPTTLYSRRGLPPLICVQISFLVISLCVSSLLNALSTDPGGYAVSRGFGERTFGGILFMAPKRA